MRLFTLSTLFTPEENFPIVRTHINVLRQNAFFLENTSQKYV